QQSVHSQLRPDLTNLSNTHFRTHCDSITVTVNSVWRCFAASFGGFKRDFPRILRTIWQRDVRCVPEKSVGGGVLFRSGRDSRCCIPSDEIPETVERSRLYSCPIPTGHESVPDRSRSTWGVVYICPWLWRLRCLRLGVL